MAGFNKKKITNWALYPEKEVTWFEPSSVPEIQELVKNYDNLIARGNGRCYGDLSLAPVTVSMLRLNKFISFNYISGEITCEAGVLLSEVLEVVVPKGYFLPVTPGTKFITVGGAIASNIHGKNHHVDGTFADHVLWIELVDEKGGVTKCSKFENERIFLDTCGGMGSTGIITKACFTLKKIKSAYITEKLIKAKNLDEILQLFDEYKHFTYSVAWIDCLAKGEDLGRSILMVGEHSTSKDLNEEQKAKALLIPRKLKLNVPFFFPSFALNPLSIKIFNFLFYHKQQKKEVEITVDYDKFFYPLDAIHNWNRIYGKTGFTQYQFVIPKDKKEGLKEIISTIAETNEGSFLAVLKLFGKENQYSSLNFPSEGYTLALDFKINKNTWKLLDKLDKLVERNNGRLYLTKDSRMSASFFSKTYKMSKQLTNKFCSFQLKRLKICDE